MKALTIDAFKYAYILTTKAEMTMRIYLPERMRKSIMVYFKLCVECSLFEKYRSLFQWVDSEK